jgi:hypothetical protein
MIDWKILNIKRVADTGVVFEVTYGCILSKEGIVKDRNVGVITLEGDPTDVNFIPYETLTEEVVRDWVYDALGDEAEVIENELLARQSERELEEQNKPLSGIPW